MTEKWVNFYGTENSFDRFIMGQKLIFGDFGVFFMGQKLIFGDFGVFFMGQKLFFMGQKIAFWAIFELLSHKK